MHRFSAATLAHDSFLPSGAAAQKKRGLESPRRHKPFPYGWNSHRSFIESNMFACDANPNPPNIHRFPLESAHGAP